MHPTLSKLIAAVILIIGLAGNAAAGLFSPPGFNSSPVDPTRYAANVGTDPFAVFVYEALKDYPNNFSNIPTRPMTEAEKDHENKVFELWKERDLNSLLRSKVDRATALRSVELKQKPIEISAIKNPPPGASNSTISHTNMVTPAVSSSTRKVYESKHDNFMVTICYEAASQEEAKVILRGKMTLIRKLLNNDTQWTYMDEAWEKTQNEQVMELNAKLAKRGQTPRPLLELDTWLFAYFWPSKVDNERHDTINFSFTTLKQPGSSKYQARMFLEYVKIKQLDQ